MLQRAGIAQALMSDPELVVLDEPTSGLDPLGRKEVRDIILDLRARKKTVFFSSHILADVQAIADRVAIIVKGKLQLASTDLRGPNGIAFSPDEKYLYVTNWDDKKKIIMRYEALAGGTLRNGTLFFDMTSSTGEDALDGMKVDQEGNLYVSGPGGVWILSAEGKHLGTIVAPKHPHNLAWGDQDGQTLYLCAQSALYRMRLNVAGIRP